MKADIPYRNQSPYGWWIATYILRAVWDDEANPCDDTLCMVWENTIILQAANREAAFTKAESLALQDGSEFQDDSAPSSRTGRWVFEGFTSLLPIYEELRDGGEILWVEHKAVPLAKVRSWVRAKSNLEVFDDTSESGDRA